jgi:hypothetical protein
MVDKKANSASHEQVPPKAEIWYIRVGEKQIGPAQSDDLVRLVKQGLLAPDMQVWCSSDNRWRRADEVSDLFVKPRQLSTGSLPPLPTIDVSQSIAASPSPKKVSSAKWRWAKIGSVIALIVYVIDFVLIRQGKTSVANGFEAIGYFIGFFGSGALLGGLVGFVAGVIRDFFASRPVVEQPITTANRPDPATEQQIHETNKLNVVSMHWRGLYPLWVSYWVITFGATIFLFIVATIIASAFSPTGYNPLAIFAALTGIWVFILAIVIWQVVGVWRSANNYAARRLSIGRKAPWAVVAKIALAFGVLNFVVTFVSSGLPQISATTRIAFMGDPDMPDYSLRIMRNGTEAEITGGFKYGLTDDFSKLLKASRQIRVVHLNSIGGRIGEAEKLYNLIRDGQLITYVHSRCLSACTIAFAGGKERYIAQGAVLGFHEPAFPGMSKDDVQASVVEQAQIFRAAGFSTDFVYRALRTPNSEMWKPTVAELIAANVITGVSDSTQFAASGFGDVTKESMATKLASAIPLLSEIKERLPQGYDAIVDAFYKSYLAGDTEADAVAAARAKLLPLLASLKPLADDDVLLELARVYADEYQALRLKSSRLCYLYASGADTTQNYSAEMPSTLVKREINARVVHTAARRTPMTEAMLEPIWKKLFALMSAQGLTDSQVNLLTADSVLPSKYSDYCAASIGLFNVVGSLPQKEAAAVMRAILSAAK